MGTWSVNQTLRNMFPKENFRMKHLWPASPAWLQKELQTACRARGPRGASPALAQGTRAGETQQGQAAGVRGAVAGLDELMLAAWGQRLRSLNKMVGPRRESRPCFVPT